jgi:hypothetical protein
MPINFFPRLSLSGAVAGSLANLDGDDLQDLDIALVGEAAAGKLYLLDADSGAADDGLNVIAPIDNAGTKRWLLLGASCPSVTVGNTILTDGNIAHPGAAFVIDVGASHSIELKGQSVSIGDADVTPGNLLIRAGAAGEGGGLAKWYTDPGDDGIFQYYGAIVVDDDWLFGTNEDTDMLKFLAGTSIEATVPFVGTTIDAGTDFTVGGTVITSGDISDDGIFTITPVTNLRVQGSGIIQVRGSGPLIEIGQSAGGVEGGCFLYGGTGNANGGALRLYCDDTQDDNGTDYFIMNVQADDLWLGPNNDTDAFQIIGGAAISAVFHVPLDVDAALTATTVDADTDFTVGGLVITDGMIADDGAFIISAATDISVTNSGGAGTAVEFNVGASDSVAGRINIFSNNSTGGGYILFRVPPDNDGDGTTYWLLDAKNATDDLHIGCSNDSDMMVFSGGATPFIDINCPLDVNAAMTATTVDADTDFTVGGTVISNNNITDDGILYINAVTSVQMQGGSQLAIGTNDTKRGELFLYGQNTNVGGTVRFYTSADADGSTEYYIMQPSSGGLLYIGEDGNTDMLIFTNDASCQFTVPLDVDAALTATTVDADTDFTVGGTVITDGVITDTGLLTISGQGVQFLGTSNVYIGQENVLEGNLFLRGNITGSAEGGRLVIDLAEDYDTDIANYTLKGFNDDLYFGPNTNPDALMFVGNGAAATIETTVSASFNEAALSSSGAAVAWNAGIAQTAVHAMTENTTISAPSNLKAGAHYTLRVVQAAGVYSLAFNAVFKWGEANAPDAPAANGDVIILSFYSDGTNMYGVEAVREEA